MPRKQTKSRRTSGGGLAAAPSHLTAGQRDLWVELVAALPLYAQRDRTAFERLVVLEDSVRAATREGHIDNVVFEEWLALRDKFHLTPEARSKFKQGTE